MNKVFLFLVIVCFFKVSLSYSEEVAPHVVRIQDYASMLQAVAASDPFRLYSEEMQADQTECGIIRAETEKGYTYNIVSGMEDQPIKNLQRLQQERYCNWLENGRPVGKEDLMSTEDGSYKLDGIMEAEGELHTQAKCYLVRGDDSEITLIVDPTKEEKTNPLMMFAEYEENRLEEDNERSTLDQQQAQRNRQGTDPQGDNSSSSQQRNEGGAVIQEKTVSRLPIREIKTNIFSDDVSEFAIDDTSVDSKNYSLDERDHLNDRLYQAEENLKVAIDAVNYTAHHFDLTYSLWIEFKNLEITFQALNDLQQQLNLALYHWQDALARFHQIQADAYIASTNSDPSDLDWNQILAASEAEVNTTFHTHQKLVLPTQIANYNYYLAEQRAIQLGVVPGVDYNFLLQEAQCCANQAAEQLERAQLVVQRIKDESTNSLKKKLTSSSKIIVPVEKEQATQVNNTSGKFEQILLKKKEAIDPPIITSLLEPLRANGENISYQDQETQLSDEGWLRYHREVVSKENDIVVETLDYIVTQVARREAFGQLLGLHMLSSEQERLKYQGESAAHIRKIKKQKQAEMEKFCKEQMNQVPEVEKPKQQPERKNLADNITPIFQRVTTSFTQCYRQSYDWFNHTLQFLQDWRIVQAEAGKVTEKYFMDKGLKIADVPTREYALQNAFVAKQLYAELVDKRIKQKEQAIERPRKDPLKELTYFEQARILLKPPVLARIFQDFFLRKSIDQSESDERAKIYFQEIGKSNLLLLEFLEKSTEIEEELKKERDEKLKSIMSQASSQEEGKLQIEQWLADWPNRLELEQKQKKIERLEQDRLAEEIKKTAILEQQRLQEKEEALRKQKEEEELIKLFEQDKKKNAKNGKKKSGSNSKKK